jgi:hypothetical protein
VAHTYNPSYSGGRDQEDQVPSQSQTVCETLSIKKPITKKRAGRVAQEVLNSKPSAAKKEKKKEASNTISLLLLL